MGIIFDGEITRQVPRQVLIDALRAEGLTAGITYGAVYRHRLYNLNPSHYRVSGGSCPITETIGSDRTLHIEHSWFSAPDADQHRIADILRKVASQAESLLTYQPAMR